MALGRANFFLGSHPGPDGRSERDTDSETEDPGVLAAFFAWAQDQLDVRRHRHPRKNLGALIPRSRTRCPGPIRRRGSGSTIALARLRARARHRSRTGSAPDTGRRCSARAWRSELAPPKIRRPVIPRSTIPTNRTAMALQSRLEGGVHTVRTPLFFNDVRKAELKRESQSTIMNFVQRTKPSIGSVDRTESDPF